MDIRDGPVPGPSSERISSMPLLDQQIPQSSQAYFPILSAPQSASIPTIIPSPSQVIFSVSSEVSSVSSSISSPFTNMINITRLKASPVSQQNKADVSFHSSRRRNTRKEHHSQPITLLENTLKLSSLGVSRFSPEPTVAPKVTISSRCRPDAKVIFDQTYFLEDSDKGTRLDRKSRYQQANDIRRGSEAATIDADVTSLGHESRLPSSDSTNTNASPMSMGSLLTGGLTTTATSTTPDADTQSVTSASSSIPASAKKAAWSTPRSWAEMAAVRGTNGNGALSTSTQVFSENVDARDASQMSSPMQRRRQGNNGKNKSKEPIGLEEAVKIAESCFTAPLTYPRGMINRGNLCFTNAILQVLVYCAPFYNLFQLVGEFVTHDFHNSTPLMEAVIYFLSEFQTISPSLQKSLIETPGMAADLLRDVQASSEPFVPEYLYEAMKLNKRFDAMRRGHQEDAEEFLGFFLDTLHEELLIAIRIANEKTAASNKGKDAKGQSTLNGKTSLPTTLDAESTGTTEREVKRPVSPVEGDGWLEVGQKGKTSFTRTTSTAHSPITRIFGGKLRSLLRVPGSKDSVTLEPYQPLQLDIQPVNVTTIEEALENLTVPETISGVQSNNQARGTVEATKQVFIETLPPILILHLKRFVYDDVGGVQKSSKVISYGPVLDISESVISPSKRAEVKRRYRLFGVIYHHGRHASGGHYTVDVLKQDQTEWIHIDDTTWDNASAPSVRAGSESAMTKQHHDGVAYLLFYVREDAVIEANGFIPKAMSNGVRNTSVSPHQRINSTTASARQQPLNHQRLPSTASQRSQNGKR